MFQQVNESSNQGERGECFGIRLLRATPENGCLETPRNRETSTANPRDFQAQIITMERLYKGKIARLDEEIKFLRY
uniref:HMMR_C domain-containing protein n=1 Tax=Mesocestoides corti TaxID=53468 RepID=A0A5K3EU51_MESCO